jgi:hypothetical protein
MRVIKAKIEIETNLSPAQIETLLSRLNEPGVRIKSVALTVPRASAAVLHQQATIYDLIAAQRQWIEDHGGNELGYVVRYGSRMDQNHYGNGGEAIYKADLDELHRLQDLVR